MSVSSSSSSSWLGYINSSIAASLAVIPTFPDLMRKTQQQLENPGSISTVEGLKKGFKASPKVGLVVGTQLAVQQVLENSFDNKTLLSNLTSSAIVGAGSSPFVAIFNGATMNKTIKESLKAFSSRQALAISTQETCSVAGLSASHYVTSLMEDHLGSHPSFPYIGAYISGALGSFVGHPANVALTRWQSGLEVGVKNLGLGLIRKTHALGLFSLTYYTLKKHMKETV